MGVLDRLARVDTQFLAQQAREAIGKRLVILSAWSAAGRRSASPILETTGPRPVATPRSYHPIKQRPDHPHRLDDPPAGAPGGGERPILIPLMGL